MGSDQQMAAPDGPAEEGAPPSSTILHRKTQAGRAEHKARAMSLAKALRLSLAKVADEMFAMSMAVIGVRSETCDGDGLADHLDASGLLMLLEGPGGTRGAAICDGALVGGLIQQQTMGKVLAGVEGEERALTQTDAAITAPFLNALLKRAAPIPEDPNEQRLIAEYRFGAWVEGTRLLCMALEAEKYELIHLSLDIAGGARQGKILLCMPKVALFEGPFEDEAHASHEDSAALDPEVTMADTVMNLEATLRITLAKIKMPLGELSGFKIDKTVQLDSADFEKVRIETMAGAVVGRGRLGQLDGVRAVQVEENATHQMSPHRRSSDRDDLDLPEVGLLTGPRQIPSTAAHLATPDVPEVSELSDLAELSDLQELPDLPDMSDLPDLEDDIVLPQLDAG